MDESIEVILDNEQENRTGIVIGVMALCLTLATAAVALRFYVRLVILRRPGLDDYALVATWITYLGVSAFTAYGTRLGLGRHISILTDAERSQFLKLTWIASIGYGVVIMLMKSSLLIQYRRVFPLPSFQQLCDVFLLFLLLWAIAGTLGATLNCQPLPRNWDPALETRNCPGRLAFWMTMGALNLATDLLLLIMPLPLLKTLRLPRFQKVAVMGVFCLGVFTCAISVIRLTTLPASTLDPDSTWTTATTVMWSVAEVSCALICMCVPNLRPLLRQSMRLQSKPYWPSCRPARNAWPVIESPGELSALPSGGPPPSSSYELAPLHKLSPQDSRYPLISGPDAGIGVREDVTIDLERPLEVPALCRLREPPSSLGIVE